MKKRPHYSTGATTFQTVLSVTLMAISAIFFASSFRAAPQPAQDGFYPPLPANQPSGFYPPLPNTPDGTCPSLAIGVALPTATIFSPGNPVFTVPVTSTLIDSTTSGGANLVGFQGDFTFDSTMITFNSPFVTRGGLTSDSNWNVSANIIGTGTVKTLRVSAFMSSFTPLAGGPGTLFFLRVQAVALSGGSNLTWAAPVCVGGGQGNEFIFIDDNLVSYDVTPQQNGHITVLYDISTPTSTPTATVTSTATATSTFTPTATATATFIATATATATATYTPIATATATFPLPTATATYTAPQTPSPTPTATAPVPPTPTPTPNPSPTPTPQPGGCVFSSGYWMNHPQAWCVETITIGCQTYTESQAIAIMRHSTSNDKTYILAQQLIAAKLNILCKGADSSCVDSTIADADAFLCAHPVGSGVPGSSSAWQQIKYAVSVLDKYNTGRSCAPSCDNHAFFN